MGAFPYSHYAQAALQRLIGYYGYSAPLPSCQPFTLPAIASAPVDGSLTPVEAAELLYNEFLPVITEATMVGVLQVNTKPLGDRLFFTVTFARRRS